MRKLKRIANEFLCNLSAGLRLKHCLGLPYKLHLELSNRCNLSCPLCPTGSRRLRLPPKDLSLSEVDKIIERFDDGLKMIYLHGFGESFLNSEIYAIIAGIKKQRDVWIEISTNGQCVADGDVERIIESGVDQILLPLDGIDEETYQFYRKGGSFSKAERFLRQLVWEKQRRKCRLPKIIVQCLILKNNEYSLKQYVRKLTSYGADKVVFKTLGVMNKDFELARSYLPSQDRYSRYADDRQSRGRKGCRLLYSGLFINAFGDVYPCCFDSMQVYRLGNLFQSNVADLWNGDRMRKLRGMSDNGGGDERLCVRCAPTGIFRLAEEV